MVVVRMRVRRRMGRGVWGNISSVMDGFGVRMAGGLGRFGTGGGCECICVVGLRWDESFMAVLVVRSED